MALIRARHGINKHRRRRLPLTVIRAMCDDETEEFIIITRRHSLGTSRRERTKIEGGRKIKRKMFLVRRQGRGESGEKLF